MSRTEKMRKFGEIFVRWNDRDHPEHMTGDHAMYEVAKLFPRITMKAWRKYCDEKEGKSE